MGVVEESSVAEMAGPVRKALGGGEDPFDAVVYTSSIEHMQPAAQPASLREARSLAGDDAVLYLTCPVTEEGRSGYEAQYRAHVYEPHESELREWLADAGWTVEQTIGLVTKTKVMRERLAGEELERALEIYDQGPRELALVMIAQLYPQAATEMGHTCRAREAG